MIEKKVNKRIPFSIKERKVIIRKLIPKYGQRCWYCGKELGKGEIYIDHILSVAEGGENSINNLALSCKFCNIHKFHYSIKDFLEYLVHIRTGHFSCPILEKLETDKIEIEPTFWDILQKSFRRG